MKTQQDKGAFQRAIERPAIYKIEQYARKPGSNAAQFFREKGMPYYGKMPGVKSVRAYQGRFGLGPTDHDIEIWLEVVSDLRAAEGYYRSVFDMELIGREAELEDGHWYTLPFDKGWDEAEAAGIKLGCQRIRRSAITRQISLNSATRIRSCGRFRFLKVSSEPPDIARIAASSFDCWPMATR